MKLDELGSVGRGRSRHRPRNDSSLYGGDYPFFQTGDIKAAELYLNTASNTYNEKGLAQSKLWEPGTLCITIAANIAESAILDIHGCFPDSVVGFIANPKVADTKFVKYQLDTLKLLMQSASRGTTQDNLSLDKLLRFDFLVPDPDTQKRIASVLSAYDDLIENNARRIAILEEMARRLYEEWFVRFRFPGHENVKFVDGLPEGWERSPLSEVTQFLSRGIAPKYDENGPSLVINQKCIRNHRLNLSPARRQCKAIPEAKSVRFGDVLINSTGVGTLGRVAQVNVELRNTTVDTHVTIVRAAEHLNLFFFGQSLLELQQHFEDQGVGATGQTELSRGRIGETTILVPAAGLQSHFASLIEPMKWRTVLLEEINANLRAQRDLLLPKLVSGEIDVAAAEKSLEDAA